MSFVTAIRLSTAPMSTDRPLNTMPQKRIKEESSVVIIIADSADQNLGANATRSDRASWTESNNSEKPTEPLEPPKSPPIALRDANRTKRIKDELLAMLSKNGYPFATGNLVLGCADGQICAEHGELLGVNFPELYCRASAFAKGQDMPKTAVRLKQSYESLEFWLSHTPMGINAIYLVSDPFVLSGDMTQSGDALEGELTLALNADWNFSCKMDRIWQGIDLPLLCNVKKNSALHCALNLKKLIGSLSGVAAKTTQTEQKEQIRTLHDNLQEREKQFRDRVRERPNIEEIDLRPLFM
ncbi:MAG: hypothetical protein LBN32_03780 [Helicobacteraceae bacterium]|nr:hypothetical protein [Helicobacteraceae bacterium]